MRATTLFAIFSVSCVVVSTGFQCERDFEPVKISHEFAEKLALFPYKKTYSLNDTIWVQFSSTNKRLFDKITNSRISADTMYLHSRFEYAKLFPNDTTPVNCKPIINTGSFAGFTSSHNGIDYVWVQTNCTNNQFAIKLGFVPLQKGTFLISPSGMMQNCPGKQKYLATTFAWTFDLADCNKDIVQQLSLSANKKAEIEAKIDGKEAFAFKVD